MANMNGKRNEFVMRDCRVSSNEAAPVRVIAGSFEAGKVAELIAGSSQAAQRSFDARSCRASTSMVDLIDDCRVTDLSKRRFSATNKQRPSFSRRFGNFVRNGVREVIMPMIMARMIVFSVRFALASFANALLWRRAQRTERPKLLPRITRAKPDLNKFKQEADDLLTGNFTQDIAGLIRNLLPTNVRNGLMATALISSIVGFILSFYNMAKSKTRLSLAILATSVVSLITQILMLAHVEDEVINEIAETLATNPQIFGPTTILHPAYHQDFMHTGGDLSPKQLELMEHLCMLPTVTKTIIRTENQNIKAILPSNKMPGMRLQDFREQWNDFVYPDWFLQIFWDVGSTDILMARRKWKATSPEVNMDEVQNDRGPRFINKDHGDTGSDLSEPEPQPSTSQAGNPFSESDDSTNPFAEPPKLRQPHTKPDLSKYVHEANSDYIAGVIRVGKKLVCVLIYLYDIISTRKQFSLTDLIKSFKLMDTMDKECTDLQELYAYLAGQVSPKKMIADTLENYRQQFNAFMEAKNYEFARDPMKVYDMKNVISNFLNYYNSLGKDQRIEAQSVYALYVLCNTRIQTYFQNDISEMSRQEPFLLLISGEGGIGKTQLARHIARAVCTQILGVDPAKHIAEITPENKYWPPLGGQTVGLFDEVGSVKDFKDDLLFKNLKGICSPSLFNAEGAAVNLKTNPINFKILIATTNTSFQTIADRIVQLQDETSVSAYFRRIILIDAKWNPARGKFDRDQPWLNNVDKDNFTHLILNRMKYDKSIKLDSVVTYESLMTQIKERENHYNKQYNAWLRRLEMVQETSKTHFSVVLHGRAGQGKTWLATKMLGYYATTYRFPAFKIASIEDLKTFSSKKRCVILLDDILRSGITLEEENIIMDFYNSRLAADSILLWTTNLSPSYARPLFTGMAITTQRYLPVVNEGLVRRIGFQGYFSGAQQPTTGIELSVADMRYYAYQDTRAITISKICSGDNLYYAGALLMFALLEVYFWYAPIVALVVACCCLGLRWKELSADEILTTLYDRYRIYVQQQHGIEVCEVERIDKRTDYNMILFSEDTDNFMNVSSARELDQHVFTDIDLFHRCEESWKIYLTSSLITEMQSNIHRYKLDTYNFDIESILALIKRYSAAFQVCGLNPKIYAEFKNIGTFQFADGKLLVARKDEQQQNENPFARVVPTIVVYGDSPGVQFGDINLSFQQALSMTPEDLFGLDLTASESFALMRFLESKEFRQNSYVRREVMEAAKNDAKNKLLLITKQLKDRFVKFISSPIGIAALVLFTIITSVVVLRRIVAHFSKDKKRRTRQTRRQNDDSDSDTDYVEERKRGNKGMPKKRSRYESDPDRREERKPGNRGKPKHRPTYDTDDEKRTERKAGNRGQPKKRSTYDSDAEKRETKMQQEDVLTLVDMNDHVSFKPFFKDAYAKARRNLCIVYQSPEDKPILDKEPPAPMCYGLFIKKNYLVTVGHLDKLKTNWYCGIDGLPGFHRMEKIIKCNERDISVWVVPTCQLAYRDISSCFLKKTQLDADDEWNAVFQRFAPGKIEEFHLASFTFYEGPDTFVDGRLRNYGAADFASFGLKVSQGGDCGLPYYIAERTPILQNKILGIHCMGNEEGGQTSTILAIITREDVEDWDQRVEKWMKMNKKKQTSACCKYAYTDLWEDHPEDEKCIGHSVVFHQYHQASYASFFEEYKWFIERNPKFRGTVMKHAGPKLYGTIHHSHTQFLPSVYDVKSDIGPWQIVEVDHIRDVKKVAQICVEIQETNLKKYINRYREHGEDFRIKAERFISSKQGVWMLRLQIQTLDMKVAKLQEINFKGLVEETEDQDDGTLVAFQSNFGSPVYVHPAINLILTGAIRNKERGKLEDVPFVTVTNNQTVKVIGSFNQSKSHVPVNNYKLSPFSKTVIDLVPIEKKPCEYREEKIPEEIKATLQRNNYGEICQRSALSLCWAHPIYGNALALREVSKNFNAKILTYYTGLRTLTDEEVLSGIKTGTYAGFVAGMELDTSIGFTLSELYYVKKKSDVIGVTDKGNYYWQPNPAAEFAKYQFEQAKELSAFGTKYFSPYTEMLKMEKLKLDKIYKGRTFVAQDLIGVLMERRNLGLFCAKAFRDDPNCGVGVDCIKDFNRIYRKINRHPHIWAGDYKNFDRNTPQVVQRELTRMLCEANPQCANDIHATMMTNIERIQISGTTLFEVHGGLPSGCYATAPMNSLNNEYLMYTGFYFLAMEDNLDPSWTAYNRHTERIYYGDDVLVSVSETYKDTFTRERVSKILMDYYGMTLDSSAKDGSSATFDTWETASWISRFFRQVGNYPMRVGALKKVSIGANFHYVSEISLPHIGSLMTKSLWEAAAWEPEYFNTIQEAVRRCIQQEPKLLKYVEILTQGTYHDEIFKEGRASLLYKFESPKCGPEPISWADEVDKEIPLPTQGKQTTSPKTLINFYKLYLFKKNYFTKFVKPVMNGLVNEKKISGIAGSYSQKVNDLFTAGKITKPVYIFTSTGPDNEKIWKCEIKTTRTSDGLKVDCNGIGNKKAEAKEHACYDALVILDSSMKQLAKKVNLCEYKQEMRKEKREINLFAYRQEMNVSASSVGRVPSAPMTATDVSVVSDSGLYTNTEAPTPARIMNSVGIALDNPAGSGAPFNKHEMVYRIFQRWTEKNTTISPSLASGAEILRISLDPSTLPKKILEYVSFHESIVPAIEVVIAIAGASGTIGWITTGWVRDAAKKDITLDDLQNVSMEETNMNGTQIIRILLNDVRRTGLYRKFKDDPEPYPGIVMMVDHAVTNVQRNDSVNYPVRVQVRLAPNCILMEPFNSPSAPSPSGGIDFNLGSYFYSKDVDFLIGSSSVTDAIDKLKTFKDYGFLTDDFKPIIDTGNVVMAEYNAIGLNDDVVPVISTKATIDPAYLADVKTLGIKAGMDSTSTPPSKIFVAFGDIEIPDLTISKSVNQPITAAGTVYKIGGMSVHLGLFNYIVESVIVLDNGCYYVLTLDAIVAKAGDLSCLVFNNCVKQVGITDDDIDAVVIPTGFGNKKIDSVFQVFDDKQQKNTTVGNPLTWVIVDNATGYPYKSILDRSKPSGVELPIPKTYVETGNNMPASNLPTGLKQASFVRNATSSIISTDSPFVPIYKPLIKNAFKALEDLIAKNDLQTPIQGTLVSSKKILGQIGYQNKTFFVRTDDFKKIYAAIGDDVQITGITSMASPQGLAVFNTKQLPSWITSTRRIRRKIDLNRYVQESAIGGGILSGLGQGLSSWADQTFRQNMLDKVLASNQAIQGANNEALATRQRDAFNRSFLLAGYNAASAQYGVHPDGKVIGRGDIGESPEIGPQTSNQLNTAPFEAAGKNFVYSATFKPSSPTTSIQGTDASNDPTPRNAAMKLNNFVANTNGNGARDFMNPNDVEMMEMPTVHQAQVLQNPGSTQDEESVPSPKSTKGSGN